MKIDLELTVNSQDISMNLGKHEAFNLVKELDYEQHDDEFTQMCTEHFCERVGVEYLLKIVRRSVGDEEIA
jgi:hypothetical protein